MIRAAIFRPMPLFFAGFQARPYGPARFDSSNTWIWRLRNHGKCNRQRVYCGNVQRDVVVLLNRSRSLHAPPLAGRRCVASNIVKHGVWALDCIGQRSFWPVQNTAYSTKFWKDNQNTSSELNHFIFEK